MGMQKALAINFSCFCYMCFGTLLLLPVMHGNYGLIMTVV